MLFISMLSCFASLTMFIFDMQYMTVMNDLSILYSEIMLHKRVIQPVQEMEVNRYLGMWSYFNQELLSLILLL